MNRILTTLALFLLMLQFMAEAEVQKRLVDQLVPRLQLAPLLKDLKLSKNQLQLIEESTSRSLVELSPSQTLNGDEFLKYLEKKSVPKTDQLVRKELMSLLRKNSSQLRPSEVSTALNHLALLSHREGALNFVSSLDCSHEELYDLGFKYTVERIKNKETQKILKQHLPKANPKKFIALKIKKFKLGPVPKEHLPKVTLDEEKALALFLLLHEYGNAREKKLTKTILDLSIYQGKIHLLNPKNPNKFWKLLASNLSPEEINLWTANLEEVASLSQKNGFTIEEAFYRNLKRKAQGNVFLLKQYEKLKSKRCFFR